MTSDTFPLVENNRAQSDKRWGLTAEDNHGLKDCTTERSEMA